jgi:hypothetical protein
MAVTKLNPHQLAKFPIDRNPMTAVFVEELHAWFDEEKNALALVCRDKQDKDYSVAVLQRAGGAPKFTAHNVETSIESVDQADKWGIEALAGL